MPVAPVPGARAVAVLVFGFAARAGLAFARLSQGAVALETTPTILAESLPPAIRGAGPRNGTAVTPDSLPPVGFDLEAHVKEIERGYIAQALQRSGGVQVKAADLLGMSFRSFRYYVKKYNLR